MMIRAESEASNQNSTDGVKTELSEPKSKSENPDANEEHPEDIESPHSRDGNVTMGRNHCCCKSSPRACSGPIGPIVLDMQEPECSKENGERSLVSFANRSSQ